MSAPLAFRSLALDRVEMDDAGVVLGDLELVASARVEDDELVVGVVRVVEEHAAVELDDAAASGVVVVHADFELEGRVASRQGQGLDPSTTPRAPESYAQTTKSCQPS